MIINYRHCSPSEGRDEVYNVPIFRYRYLYEIPWKRLSSNLGAAVRIIIQESPSTLPLDVLYIPRDSDRLLVGLHGLENRSKTSLPKFQFVNSFTARRRESLLFLSDSTLLCDDKITISWMAGTPSFNVAHGYSLLINSLLVDTGIASCVLAGHSAGGTAAIKIGSEVPGSIAVAVNPQISSNCFHGYAVDVLRKAVYPHVPSGSELLQWYPTRFDLRRTFDSRLPGSAFKWFSHIEDSLSFSTFPSWPTAVEYFDLPDFGGFTSSGDEFVLCNWHTENQHKHALPGGIMPFVRYALGEDPFFDLNIISQ
ncbi:hypothetical protein M0E84_10630 [Corynebacterium sp. CCM 9186]|uniref:hypothetical protein n=1 Tax=Corynebacterium meridianum TaxID=2765363 RepID=UPI002005659F|nr:hypothetical protein [Corynebacterium meridianum]MCK7678478.1 hypothetical protein [Corynebacterium meridianum]